MKRVKIVVIAFIVAYGIIASFAFKTHKNPKSLIPVSYFYKSNTANQKLTPGVTGQTPATENSIIAPSFKTYGNWSRTIDMFSVGSAYIALIQFEEEADPFDEDGGDDGELTLYEALTAVWDAYTAPNPDAMPNSVLVGSATITIVKASAAH